MSLFALINRGNNNIQYNKCMKDFIRLQYLFSLLKKTKETKPILLSYIGYDKTYYEKIFQLIISIVPHCSNVLDDTEKASLLSDYFHKLPVDNLITSLISNLLDERDIDDNVIEKYKKMLETQINIYKINNEIDYFKQKYYDYKFKYLQLKKQKLGL